MPHVAIIGAGYWGRNLVRNYYPMGALKLICDKNEHILVAFREQYPGVETCFALNDVLSRKDIDGVVIATPAETHYMLAREALLSGRHVYVEKPLVLDEEQAVELIGIAREKKRILMVGHLLQYHPVFIRLKAMAVSGELGRINYIYSNRLNLGKIRREENSLWSFAPHDISMILAIAGESPEQVIATGGNYLHQKLADVTTTHLEFSSGMKAHVFVSWLHPFKEQKLVVVGDRKMAVFDDTRPWGEKLLLYAHEIKWEQGIPVPAKAEPERIVVAETEPLRNECEHFLECMRTGQKPVTDGEEGLRVLRILNAAQRSLDQGGCSVRPGKAATPPFRASVPAGAHGSEAADFFVHPTAIVDDGASIGAKTRIWHFSHVLPNSSVGEACNIGQNVVIGPHATIGRGCKIQNNVAVYQGVELEDFVFCGPSMVFTNVFNPRAHIPRMDEIRKTKVKTGATLGANCTIVCGLTIGRYAFVGAGAVVTRDVPDHALMVGNPARRIGWMCACGNKLDATRACPACANRYKEVETGLALIS